MLTEKQIDFLNRVCTDTWTECNGVINVNGNVDISRMNLTEIPVQFEQVTGYFICRENVLTTLKGSPFIVNAGFDCDSNRLTSLEAGPKNVNLYYSCKQNLLTSLIGAPEICNTNFFCSSNQLTSLEGCPKVIKYNLYYKNNPDLKYLWGIGRVESSVYYDNHNEINKWIIECSRKGVIFPYTITEENINWIKITGQYSCLFRAPKEILQYLPPIILHSIHKGIF